MKIRSYKDLEVWKLSKDLAKDVYKLTKRYPIDERFGLMQQTRRAVVSVMSNIAEGSGRRSRQEFMRFINIASGSLCEMESQLLLAVDLEYLGAADVDDILTKADRISKMLYGLHQSLLLKTDKPAEYRVPSTEYDNV
ncbi:MAG: four helix bundle protein [Pseudomonadota bacterium]|nr:four helix bundle protein [Pseudomonadota bacterium]MDE3038392.1 four helix bundle protein [Pseudomonadota bacterium]